MAGRRKFSETLMRQTDKLRSLFGPADVSDPKTPVVHKHDAYENESDREVRDFDIETDSHGHHYAVRKSGKTWNE